MAGFDMDGLMEWAGLRAAEARGAMGGGAGGVGAAEGGEVATPARADEATATAAPPADARAANEADGAVPAGATEKQLRCNNCVVQKLSRRSTPLRCALRCAAARPKTTQRCVALPGPVAGVGNATGRFS